MVRPLLILLLLAAAPARAEAPRVVTDTPVTASLVAQVMGDLGTPQALLDRGADPHHAQLRPSQVRALAGADLVVWIGPALSPWLASPLDGIAQGAVLTLADVEGLHVQAFLTTPQLGPADDDDDGPTDPHLWLDPQNTVPWLRAIAAALASSDPDHASLYATRAEAAVGAVLDLQAELAETLAPVGDTGLVMFHDAYGYLATAFGLNIVANVSDGEATAPGAARLAELRATLAGFGATCLFPEANHPADFVRVVAEGSALRIGAPLDPAGMTLDAGPGLYAATMRGLARAIADCAAG